MTFSCSNPEKEEQLEIPQNPFFTDMNVPIDFASISAEDVKVYAEYTVSNCSQTLDQIKSMDSPGFEELFGTYDKMLSELTAAYQLNHMLYWVSPDSAIRAEGEKGSQLLDSMFTAISSDKELYQKVLEFSNGEEYSTLLGSNKNLVDDILFDLERSGVSLDEDNLANYKKLNGELTALSSDYSKNMNTANFVLELSSDETDGISESFLSKYEKEGDGYEIPVMPATRGSIMDNATDPGVRKRYHQLYYTRGADKNLEILDQLVEKRYQLAQVMSYDTYAQYNLAAKMAKDPETVWNFIYDLLGRAKEKAGVELTKLNELKAMDSPGESIQPWDISYYQNKILKEEYNVDHELIREYLPMKECLVGMMKLYQELLGIQFKKVKDASVWHEDVEMYQVLEDDKLVGIFYLDLYPRPFKESWFYGVPMIPARKAEAGYQVPVSMLLGNFTKPTDELPSLLSYRELNTLFHEFGHIMDGMANRGEFAYQNGSKSDFVEAMSQIFENWIEDYEILNSFAKHYESGEPFPKETFDNMKAAKNVSSGLNLVIRQQMCMYDMNLYDKYQPDSGFDTDELWKQIDEEIGLGPLVDYSTHPQANWIHINTHPVYYYGYFWSEVYAQDMFTEFEKNGLRDQQTGIRYRNLILANGTKRDIVEAVEEFLGRPSNNQAYLKGLGFEEKE